MKICRYNCVGSGKLTQTCICQPELKKCLKFHQLGARYIYFRYLDSVFRELIHKHRAAMHWSMLEKIANFGQN